MGTAIKSLSLDYHICSVQHIIATCLQHPQLQDELYCQLLRQLSGHTSPPSSNTLQVCGRRGGEERGGEGEGRRGEGRRGGGEGRRGEGMKDGKGEE